MEDLLKFVEESAAKFVSVDPEGDAAFVEAGKPVFQEAARLTGWPLEEVGEIHPNGMGPRTNVRIFRKSEPRQYMDVRMAAEFLK